MAETKKENRQRADKLVTEAMKKKRSIMKDTLDELKEQVKKFKSGSAKKKLAT